MIKRIAVAFFLLSWPALAQALDLPKEKVIIHSVRFSDPRGDSDLIGGNAFDRAAVDIGVNKSATNTALLTVTPAKASALVEVFSADSSIASVSRSQQTLTVSGVARGITFIKTKRRSEKLGASVFTPQQLTIALHIISDTAGHSAGLSSSQVGAILQVADGIWGGQANFTFGPNPQITANQTTQDLGSSVDLITGQRTADHVAVTDAARNPAVGINVYFVHALTTDGTASDGVYIDDDLGDIFITVNSKDINRSLAHELGHALGLIRRRGYDVDYSDSGAAGTRRYQLMYGNSADVSVNGGRTITPFQGNVVNPTIGTP